MNDFITNELMEATYLFCIKRISDTEAAKDLAQDILYEALRAIASGKEFVSFHSWYWRMARNKYANYISHKQNHTLPIETAGGMAAELLQPIESIIASEDISTLNYSLSRLAAIYREIIVRFYLKEQSVNQIANDLCIPVGTVKRRLFDAKKSLKERFDNMNNIGKTAYAPVDVSWFWGYSAQKASLLMEGSKICPQVMVICRNEAKNVNEIADEMGVAPVYLEEILEKMEKEQLLISPAKGKYLANCCIFPREKYMQAELFACDIFHDNHFGERITDKLLGIKDKITSLDFYGNHFDYSYLMWLLYVQAGYIICDIGEKYYESKNGNKFPKEADRNYNVTMHYVLPDEIFNDSIYDKLREKSWSCLGQSFITADYGKVLFRNDYEIDPFPCEQVDDNNWRLGRDTWVDGNNISLLISLSENPERKLSVHEEAMAAEFLKNGLLKKEDNRLSVQLPIFNQETHQKIQDILREELKEIAEEYVELISEGIKEILLPYVRKDLMSCFVNWDMHCFFEPKRALFYYGWNDFLAQPEDYSTSAAGLYIIK
ncbi:MAG: sigma-70 family RNA polymerase sigma factor [Lachnospiraceae bacterium]|nr:sigma-70 family RNA polymerase sigma factor [Lachnospiraceae bacterium]